MEHGAQPFSSDARMTSAQEEASRVQGQVKWFDFAKGYGFITPTDGSSDILLHQACVRQSGFKAVKEGATVTCEVVAGPRGLQAIRLISLDNSTAHPMPPSAERAPRHDAEPQGPWQSRHGQMVQPRQGLWLCIAGPRHARHFRAYGSAAALRHRGIA